jgi:hypothetical protein
LAPLTPDFTALPDDTPGGRSAVVRIIPRDLDAIAFFERLTPSADIDALVAVLSLTSPSLLAELGDLHQVPPQDRGYGPGSGWVVPVFTQRVRPTRFSDGRFGVWYAASDQPTAIAETLYHQAKRLRETSEPAQDVALQILTADLAGYAAVLTTMSDRLGAVIHDPDGYAVSQAVGQHLRDRRSDAIVYRSVRRSGGICYGALRPSIVRGCRRTGLIRYAWDGRTLTAGAAT